MSTNRRTDDPHRDIDMGDGTTLSVQMWYRDGLPDHIAIDSGEFDVLTLSIDEPDAITELAEVLAEYARNPPPRATT